MQNEQLDPQNEVYDMAFVSSDELPQGNDFLAEKELEG